MLGTVIEKAIICEFPLQLLIFAIFGNVFDAISSFSRGKNFVQLLH